MKSRIESCYDYSEHIHRYAVWTAVCAVRRGFTNGNNITEAIDKIYLKKKASECRFSSQDEFDNWHNKICSKLLEQMENIKGATYGRAAKIINIYLKTSYLNLKRRKFIHPPIDRILIQSFLKQNPEKKFCNKNWTTFNEADYLSVIRALRSKYRDELWKAEELWEIFNKNLDRNAKLRSNKKHATSRRLHT